MNKTLLVAALVTAGLSANVMALSFVEGDFRGSVDINGTITVPVVSAWEWSAGDALVLDSNFDKMTNPQNLSIVVPTNHALLVGQTKAGMNGQVAGSGIVPTLSFTDVNNNPVNINFPGGGQGNGKIVLPVTAADNSALGQAEIDVKALGVTVRLNPILNVYDILGNFAFSGQSAYFGGVGDAAGKTLSGVDAAVWTGIMGGKDQQTLVADVATAAGVTSPTIGLSTADAIDFGNTARIFASSYGLGIPANGTVGITFTNPITATTQWKAPLNMTVTHI